MSSCRATVRLLGDGSNKVVTAMSQQLAGLLPNFACEDSVLVRYLQYPIIIAFLSLVKSYNIKGGCEANLTSSRVGVRRNLSAF